MEGLDLLEEAREDRVVLERRVAVLDAQTLVPIAAVDDACGTHVLDGGVRQAVEAPRERHKTHARALLPVLLRATDAAHQVDDLVAVLAQVVVAVGNYHVVRLERLLHVAQKCGTCALRRHVVALHVRPAKQLCERDAQRRLAAPRHGDRHNQRLGERAVIGAQVARRTAAPAGRRKRRLTLRRREVREELFAERNDPVALREGGK